MLESITNFIDLMNYIFGSNVTADNNPFIFGLYVVCGMVLLLFIFRVLLNLVLSIFGVYKN